MTNPRAIARDTPVEGTVEFVQHALPGLDSGAYLLSVGQSLSTQEADLGNQYFFAIQSPRFTLNPGDVLETYPPDQAEGEFDHTLPHVVLTNRTLPWQRYPTLAAPPREFPDGRHERDLPTWLTVLVFDADDEAAFPGFRAQARPGAVRELFIARLPPATQQGYSYFWAQPELDSDSPDLASHLDHGESPDDPCQILDVPLRLFWASAPSSRDLEVMAHLRNVNLVRKATQNGVPAGRNDLSKVPGTSDFALVLGNRLPRRGVRCFAHLVSLEGLAPFLPIDPATSDAPDEVTDPTTIPGPNGFDISAGGYLRLVSLRSWSFTSTGDSNEFERLLLGLSAKAATDPPDYSIGRALPPVDGAPSQAEARVRTAISMGFTALGHQTRDGGQTVSWYRGPLVPTRLDTRVLPESLPSSDAATAYDPASGMFDLSYSAAWQIGRLLAIHDKHFSTALCDWRASNLRGALSRLDALDIQQTLTGIHVEAHADRIVRPLLTAFAPTSAAPPPTVRVAGAAVRLTGARALRADSHRSMLTDPGALGSLLGADPAVPAPISEWLGRLSLLEGVPFRYLVPDEEMLPPESIRFFHLDMNWVNALLDGAQSIGRHVVPSSPEAVHDKAVSTTVLHRASGEARTLRPAALGLAEPAPHPLGLISGFLLRSDAVRGWPFLEVDGYAPDGTMLDIVRFERLAPTVLFCLFEKDGRALHRVDLHEPAEGLHFGLSGGSAVNVRSNQSSNGRGPGSQVKGVLQAAPLRRTGAGRQVIRLFRLACELRDPKYAEHIQGIYEGFDHLPASQFAMQMLRGVGLVSFVIEQEEP